jgi:hypothetical protein
MGRERVGCSQSVYWRKERNCVVLGIEKYA